MHQAFRVSRRSSPLQPFQSHSKYQSMYNARPTNNTAPIAWCKTILSTRVQTQACQYRPQLHSVRRAIHHLVPERSVPPPPPCPPSPPPPIPSPRRHAFQIVLQGVNSTAIGLVVAACVLLWGGAIENYADAIVAVFAGCMQVFTNR